MILLGLNGLIVCIIGIHLLGRDLYVSVMLLVVVFSVFRGVYLTIVFQSYFNFKG